MAEACAKKIELVEQDEELSRKHLRNVEWVEWQMGVRVGDAQIIILISRQLRVRSLFKMLTRKIPSRYD